MALAGVFIASLAINNIANTRPCPHLLLRLHYLYRFFAALTMMINTTATGGNVQLLLKRGHSL